MTVSLHTIRHRRAANALELSARRLRRALELANGQRANLTVSSSEMQHTPGAAALHTAAQRIQSLLSEALDVLDSATVRAKT